MILHNILRPVNTSCNLTIEADVSDITTKVLIVFTDINKIYSCCCCCDITHLISDLFVSPAGEPPAAAELSGRP